jgi:hypothetical protein
MADFLDEIRQYCKNPHLRKLFYILYDTSTGHDHDGTNSKSVTTGTPGAGTVTNTMLATDVKVGSLAALTTTANSSVQAAINELDSDIGDLSSLTTTATGSLMLAINELDGDIGNLATLTTTAKSSVVAAINELDAANSSFATLTGIQTLTNKTLTSPTITTMLINDGDTGLTVTSANQTHAAPTATIPDIGDAADTFVMNDTAATLTNKTVTDLLIDDTDAGCTLTSSDQTAADATATIPDMTTSDTFVMLAVSQTLTNKTLTTATLTTPLIDDSDAGCTLTSADQTDAAATATIPDMGTSDNFVMEAVAQTLTNKTLTSPTITTMLIDDGDAGCTLTSVDQTNGSATVTIPDIGDAADNMVLEDTAQTLTNKTLTSPVLNTPDLTFGYSSHDFSGGTSDWTLSASEDNSLILDVTNSGGATNINAPATAGKMYILRNETGSNCTILVSGQTGVAVATNKTAIVKCNGTDYERVTADA